MQGYVGEEGKMRAWKTKGDSCLTQNTCCNGQHEERGNMHHEVAQWWCFVRLLVYKELLGIEFKSSNMDKAAQQLYTICL
jgi:hypothetical protein